MAIVKFCSPFLPFGLLLACCAFTDAQTVEEFDSTTPAAQSQSQPVKTKGSVNAERVARKIVSRTNAFRRKRDLSVLAENQSLQETAQYFAEFMAGSGRYGHRADGNSPSERAKEHGYDYCIVLENIAYAYDSRGFSTGELAGEFFDGWKNSQGHRENMLDPDVTEIGVAVSRSDDRSQYYSVQMFGRPHSATIRFTITNTSGQEVEYSIDRRNSQKTFSLPARVARTHVQCRPSEFDFGWTKQDDSMPVKDKAKYVVEKDAATETGLRIRAITANP